MFLFGFRSYKRFCLNIYYPDTCTLLFYKQLVFQHNSELRTSDHNFKIIVSTVDYVRWDPCLALSSKPKILVSLLTYLKCHASYVSFCSFIYRVSQEECARLREGVPYAKIYRYNPKHLCPKWNGYGDNGQRSLKL